MSLSHGFIPKDLLDVWILNRVGLSWGGDGGGAKGQGARAGDIYVHARLGHFQEKPKDKTLICFYLSFYLFNLFFWGSEAHLVFRFRFEDSVSPS